MVIKQRHFVQYAVLAVLVAGLAGCSTTKTLTASTSAKGKSGTINAAGRGNSGGATRVQGGDANPSSLAGRVVYFDFDSFAIRPEYQGVIDQQARYLQSHATSHVMLEGNTDERGSREYNLALGQKRAEAVQRALVLVGATNNQIEAISLGAEKPADPGHTEDAYAKNRRVEFRYR